ncbi:MAG: hypothetical protein ACXW2T_07295, partial [Allosphingosinicella sp.]
MKRFTRIHLLAATAVAALLYSAPGRADPTPECNDGLGGGTTECGSNSSTGPAGNEDSTAVGQDSSATADEA